MERGLSGQAASHRIATCCTSSNAWRSPSQARIWNHAARQNVAGIRSSARPHGFGKVMNVEVQGRKQNFRRRATSTTLIRCQGEADGEDADWDFSLSGDEEEVVSKDIGSKTMVVLQAYDWKSCESKDMPWFGVIERKIKDIKAMGFTHVILPPISRSADPQGFLPSSFYDLTSNYGTPTDLRSLLDALHDAQLTAVLTLPLEKCMQPVASQEPIAVLADGHGDQSQHHQSYQSEALEEIVLEHANASVQEDCTGWLRWLRFDLNFDGWCFSPATGLAPQHALWYCRGSSPQLVLADVWTPMNYEGEALAYDQDSHRQHLEEWADNCGSIPLMLDYTTKGILQQAVLGGEYWRLIDPQGRAPGLMGLAPSSALTFVDTHLTGSAPRQWPFPDWGVLLGYVYIMTHPGTPSISWDHVFQWELKEAISDLIQLRRRNHISASSSLRILAFKSGLYVARIGSDVHNDERFTGLVVKMGPQFDMMGLEPGLDWRIAFSGPDCCVWEKE